MAESPSISSLPPKRNSQHFDALRAGALEEVQRLAARSWTDHNPHDPGVTIMEAFCYAMTELGMRVELDVADLIASGGRRSQARLQPAQRVLPCGAVTSDDLRDVLLDHYLVGDAWLDIGVPDIVGYFEDQASNPPLTFVPGTARVTPDGLYEVLLAFEDLNLNSNTFSLTIDVGSDSFNLDFALPHWDEPEAQPFRAGSITLNSVTMLNPGSEWRNLDESLAFFGEATIAFTGPNGAGTVDTWVLMRITDELDQSAAVIPGILASASVLVESTAADDLIDLFVQRVADAEAAVSTVRRYLLTWRNLTEFPVKLAVSRIQEIAVHARVEVAGATELENLLANMFFALDCSLSPPVLFEDLATQHAAGRSSETIFDGPLLTHGFLAENREEALVREDQIFLSDVMRLIMEPMPAAGADVSRQENPSGRDIVAVTDLALSNYINNRIITSQATGCLRLVDIKRYRPRLSLAKSRIVFVRDDVEIAYDFSRVEARFQELRAEKRDEARLEQFDPDWPVPPGDDLPIDDYYPFQNDLPAIYGVTEAGLPGSASIERRQQALQMRAYLLLFEQFLADTAEQLINVNRFFSPSGEEATTYFTRPLLELAEMDKLVRSFDAGNWADFLANPDNAHAQALRSAAEDEAIALDRRNRMLDHLLARHAEDAVAWGQELHRWGQKSLLSTTVNIATLPERVRVRRLQVNRRLLRSKADFLAAIPELHALRQQSFGDPMHWVPDLVAVERSGPDYVWRLARNGVFVFEAPIPAGTEGEALVRAREVVQLAGAAAFYDAVDLGGPGNRRYVLRSGAGPSDQILAQGTVGFPSLAAAAAAAVPVRADLEALRLRESRTAMERRIDHLVGVRYRGRRALLNPLADFFEVFDVAGPAFTKHWRLWSGTGFAGDTLMVADATFSDPGEPAAIALAHADIERALEFAVDEWNYLITEVAPATYSLELIDMDEVVLAAAPATFTSLADAETARDRIIAHLYDRYSAEGFHMVENLLLRPQAADATSNPFLAVPIGDTESLLLDPYSQRLTIVLPSGYERDFEDPDELRTPCRPHRFRDREFRRHAERIIRQSCPAHILPDIRWVDRRAPGSAAADGSFDVFEPRFFSWLNTLLIADATEPAITDARRDLGTSIGAIVNG